MGSFVPPYQQFSPSSHQFPSPSLLSLQDLEGLSDMRVCAPQIRACLATPVPHRVIPQVVMAPNKTPERSWVGPNSTTCEPTRHLWDTRPTIQDSGCTPGVEILENSREVHYRHSDAANLKFTVLIFTGSTWGTHLERRSKATLPAKFTIPNWYIFRNKTWNKNVGSPQKF